jgi:hypothetical protein
MSKSNLFTVEEDKLAASQGWGLHHVYDLKSCAWSVRILPAHMAGLVLNLAKANQPLPLKALRLIKEHHVI